MTCDLCDCEMGFVGYDTDAPCDENGKPLYAVFECPECGYKDEILVEYF